MTIRIVCFLILVFLIYLFSENSKPLKSKRGEKTLGYHGYWIDARYKEKSDKGSYRIILIWLILVDIYLLLMPNSQ